jgi:hypothetical protein
MRRAGLAFLTLLATTGASPVRSLPIPPIPPAHPPADRSAPVPDLDAKAPLPDEARGTRVVVNNFRYRSYDQSMGYTPGSQFQSSEEKRVIQTPGLLVRVPLQ